MIVRFTDIDFNEIPLIILKNTNDNPLGVIGCVTDVTYEGMFNEVSTLSFNVPAFVDGEKMEIYDELQGMRIVDIPSLGVFTLTSPHEIGDGVTLTKQCKAYSLEYEFSFKKISLEEETYKLWDDMYPQETLLGIILDMFPNWSVSKVPSSIANRYRTFSVSNTNVYNFIKDQVQQTYNCIFDFDTRQRTINVIDAAEEPVEQPVYLSLDNLATAIEITENTDEIVTRLDVRGADDLDIREVNPCGTNSIINLEYFMNPKNFSQELIDKYHAWVEKCKDKSALYYSVTIEYSIAVTNFIAQSARLTDLKNELVSLENVQALIIAGISQNVKTQEDLDAVNAEMEDKQNEIFTQEQTIKDISSEREELMDQLRAIRDECAYANNFTKDEQKELDRYIRDGELSDASFAVSDMIDYTEKAIGKNIAEEAISFTDAEITPLVDEADRHIYTIKGGRIAVGTRVDAEVRSAIVEYSNSKLVVSVHLNSGTMDSIEFPGGCISITGTSEENVPNGTTLDITYSGYFYFSLNASEYEKRSVAWDLFQYGEQMLEKMSQPSYFFNVSSANFFALEDFVSFRDSLRFGDRVYIELPNGDILRPVCIGVTFDFLKPEALTLKFGDSFVTNDPGGKLVDLIEQSISAGHDVALNKNSYMSFKESGAATGIKDFMDSSLDVSKNNLMSSSEQAIQMDGSGIRLRAYANDSHTAYEDEQIWMNNNSILLTDDGWKTAKMAIGKIFIENHYAYGIVADAIYGKLLAGERMVIESSKEENGTSVFRVDEDGCRIFNGDLAIARTDNDGNTRQVILNPDVGIVIGDIGCIKHNDETGADEVDATLAHFWMDGTGGIHMSGDGETPGSVSINTNDGIVIIGENNAKFEVNSQNMGFYDQDGNVMLAYEAGDMTLVGRVIATSGYIGGTDGSLAWTITDGAIYSGDASAYKSEHGTYIGVDGISIDQAFGVTVDEDGNGIIDIGCDGRATINLASFQVRSDDSEIVSDRKFVTSSGIVTVDDVSIIYNPDSGEGDDSQPDENPDDSGESEDERDDTDDGTGDGEEGDTPTEDTPPQDDPNKPHAVKVEITSSYKKAEFIESGSLPSVKGKLIQIVHDDIGLNIYSSTLKDVTRMDTAITPNVPPDGHGYILGWDFIDAVNMNANYVYAEKVYSDEMYIGVDGIAVADQKWVVDTIVDTLKNGDIVPKIKKDVEYLDSYVSSLTNHTHSFSVDSTTGVVTIGGPDYRGGGSNFFNIADTKFFQDAISAAEKKGSDAAKVTWITTRGDPSYNSSDNTYSIALAAVRPDGTWAGVDTISISATAAYNAGKNDGYQKGKDDGYQSGYSSGKNSVSVRSVDVYDEHVSSSGKVINASLDVELTNGDTDAGVISVDASGAYKAGSVDVWTEAGSLDIDGCYQSGNQFCVDVYLWAPSGYGVTNKHITKWFKIEM